VLFSDKHHFAFIHVPKTAGMSVHRALAKAAPDAIRRIEEMPAFSDPEKQRHLPARDLRDYLGEMRWKRLFSFAFVRNPFARLVSWYNMCHERPSNRFMWFVKDQSLTFRDFIIDPSDILGRTRLNQIDYISDSNGQFIVNFIGRYEQLEQDFDFICRELEFSTELPHVNSTKSVDYRAYYDASTHQVVAQRFRRDIEAFGYTF
jgi:chondroitin 4-sulfotransferase 11